MDVLSESMSRLCADITGLRRARHELKQTLTQGSLMRRAAMEHLCHDFAATRVETGTRRERERMAFLAQLRRNVNQQRQALSNDLSGARLAWMGKAVEMSSRAAVARPSTRSRNK